MLHKLFYPDSKFSRGILNNIRITTLIHSLLDLFDCLLDFKVHVAQKLKKKGQKTCRRFHYIQKKTFSLFYKKENYMA